MSWSKLTLSGLAIFLLLGFSAAGAQSLGEVARSERAKKGQGASTAKKVLTEDDMKKPGAGATPVPDSGGSLPPHSQGSGPNPFAGNTSEQLQAAAFLYSMMEDSIELQYALLGRKDAEKAKEKEAYRLALEDVRKAARAQGFQIKANTDAEKRKVFAALSPQGRQALLKENEGAVARSEGQLRRPCNADVKNCQGLKDNLKKLIDALRADQVLLRSTH